MVVVDVLRSSFSDVVHGKNEKARRTPWLL